MTIGAWLFGVGLALLAGWFIAGPLVWQGGPAASPRIGSQRLQMLERKAALLSAIREIDADVPSASWNRPITERCAAGTSLKAWLCSRRWRRCQRATRLGWR